MVTVGCSRLQQVTEWLQWVTAGYGRLPSSYSGLKLVRASYRVVTMGSAGYSKLSNGYSVLQQVAAR